MKPLVKIALLWSMFALSACFAPQRLKKQNELLQNKLASYVTYLADDRLEGRRTGTAGEKLAMQYIADEFSKAGLAPKGTDGYFQSFSVNEGKKMGSDCKMIIANKALAPGKDFFVFPYSANA